MAAMAMPIYYFGEFEKKMPNLTGKTIAITGTTTGTGYVAALACLKKGATVIVMNRDSARSQEALLKLQRAVPNGQVSQISCDLQSFESVRNAAKELNAKCGPTGLDVLACNAGIMAFPNTPTVDGFDIQMQTNQISHFLLVKEALPLLKDAAEKRGEARIVTHSSVIRHGDPLEAKYFGKSGPALGGDGTRAALARYHHSKLANAVFAHALASKLGAAGFEKIKALSCAPGIAATSLADSSATLPNMPRWLPSCCATKIVQSQEDGAMPILTAMVDPDARARDFFCPSYGPLCCAGEYRGPVQTLREPLPKAELVCADVNAQEILWRGCEEAIGEPFTL